MIDSSSAPDSLMTKTGKTLGELRKPRSEAKVMDFFRTRGILVPDVYWWLEYDLAGKPVSMTAAFTYFSKRHGLLRFGEIWPVEKEWNGRERQTFQRKLCGKLVETLDVLVHHGDRILDSFGNVNARLVQDAEAERFWLDKQWADRLGAFAKIVKVKTISFEKAKELKYI